RTLTWVLGAGLAACLINPHHVRVFALPAELFPNSQLNGLQTDVRFARLFVSPFQSAYLNFANGLNVCGIAYYPLLLTGAVSFVITRNHWRLWRLLVFTALAALSASSVSVIPFFAVVAGPIAALNFQDYAAGRADAKGPAGVRVLRLALSARLLTLLLGVI